MPFLARASDGFKLEVFNLGKLPFRLLAG